MTEMTETKFFHFGQFFSKRALIATVIGVGLVAVTEFVLPFFNILTVRALWDWFTPVTITFTLAVIMVTCAIARNIVASILITMAAALSFYHPFDSNSSTAGYAFTAAIIIFLVTALLSGFFATREMSGQSAFLSIGILFGIQGLIGAGISLATNLTSAHEAFFDYHVNVAYGESVNGFPVFDVVLAVFSLVYMIAFIILSRKRYTASIEGKKFEIFGQILIFLAIAGALVFSILSHGTYDEFTANSIYTEENTQFFNILFEKERHGIFSSVKLLNIFYILPIVGFIIGLGLALIVHQRAEGTLGYMKFNFEGSFFSLNIAVGIIAFGFSSTILNLMNSSFYLRGAAFFTLFTEFTNLLLLNMLIAYVIFLIITIIRRIANK